MRIAALLTSYKHGSITQAEAVAEIESLIELERIQLRDEFAGQALPAVIGGRSWDHISDDTLVIRAWAECAYLTADAMLKARKS